MRVVSRVGGPLFGVCFTVVGLACGSRTEPLVERGARTPDGGAPDAGGRIDAGRPPRIDGGARVDAGMLADAGTDAGPPVVEPCPLGPVEGTSMIDVGMLNSGSPSVVAVSDGFLAAWSHPTVDYTSLRGELLVRHYDVNGRPLGDAIDIGHDGNEPSDAWLHATADGPLATWFEQPIGIGARGCFRWLHDDGSPRGDARCPDELAGGSPIVSATDDEVLVTPVGAGPRTVFRITVDGTLAPVATLPEIPSGVGRIGGEVVWLRWIETSRFRGTVELVAGSEPRVVLTDVRRSQGILRALGDGVRVLWRSPSLIVTDVTSAGVREVLRVDPPGMVGMHPELSADGHLAFGGSDASGMTLVQVEEVGRGTTARGTIAPGPEGCYGANVAIGHDRVAVAWVGDLEGSAHCTPHFVVLACEDVGG